MLAMTECIRNTQHYNSRLWWEDVKFKVWYTTMELLDSVFSWLGRRVKLLIPGLSKVPLLWCSWHVITRFYQDSWVSTMPLPPRRLEQVSHWTMSIAVTLPWDSPCLSRLCFDVEISLTYFRVFYKNLKLTPLCPVKTLLEFEFLSKLSGLWSDTPQSKKIDIVLDYVNRRYERSRVQRLLFQMSPW